jgi:adenylate cyclase
MEPPGVERRLAAILAADMVGYSRLMEADEAGTLARLRTHRLELIDPAIAKNKGRIIKTTGDGMLVEFQSVTEAVQCAVEVQQRMARRNADVAPARWIQFRIGINLGDVIVEGDDIFGDGVNVAARLEALAEPGGICVSGAVRDQVGNRLELAFTDLGEQGVKNIARPIRAYAILLDSTATVGAPPQPAATAGSAAAKPSIAVLPFANMSGDPEQEFFADGLTEDIITELSRFRDLLVISRNSAFVHKGKAVRVQSVAREFGVQYVVEGSVRKAGNRVRVTVQLIDAEADRHVWAEPYDCELEDIFAIQDEITGSIIATLPGRVEAATHDRANRKPTDNMMAYECVLAGKVLHHRSTPRDNAEAQRLLERALALDADYAHAHAWKACVLGQTWVNGWCADREATWDQVVAELGIALALDDHDSDVHRILAAVSLAHGDHDKAAYHQERALALNPNNDLILVQQGELLTWLGRPEDGIEWIRKAMRLNPYHPERFWNHLGRAFFVARRYAEAVEAFSRIGKLDHTHHAFRAAALAQMGDETAATAHA